MAEMNVKQFAEYVIDNMHRATLENALGDPSTNKLGIAGKLDVAGYYSFTEFISEIEVYLSDSEVLNRLGSIKSYKILVACDTSERKYSSEFKYQKRMIIDMFVMSLWEIINDR